ncbi:Alpha/Beta hydrolase protein [Daldinia bambusicola]|nr:Alpha/Beta hydrolase protein [Daldinia bambusicola]
MTFRRNKNPWSWNRDYNLLYVDQPVQTGFSYNVPTKGLLDLETSNIVAMDSDNQGNNTFIPGAWAVSFSEHDTRDSSISIWTESYGGRYGPSFSVFIHEQNIRIKDGSLTDVETLNLTTLGIINGCVDLLIQETSAPEFAHDGNYYNIAGITDDEFSNATNAYWREGGYKTKIDNCLSRAKDLDPGMFSNVAEVNKAYEDVSDFCQNEVEGPYLYCKKWAFYDIAYCYLDAFPGNEYVYYLANEEGNRDFACNWIGGERVRLNINYKESDGFKKAGYADITIDGSTPVGQVRQHNLFSFTRVYQSGHMVPA